MVLLVLVLVVIVHVRVLDLVVVVVGFLERDLGRVEEGVESLHFSATGSRSLVAVVLLVRHGCWGEKGR